MADYPESNAVLVRRHGVYVWGKDWIQAKTQAECYDYLFEAALRMHALGIDAARPPAPLPVSNGHHDAGPVASQYAMLQPCQCCIVTGPEDSLVCRWCVWQA